MNTIEILTDEMIEQMEEDLEWSDSPEVDLLRISVMESFLRNGHCQIRRNHDWVKTVYPTWDWENQSYRETE